MPNETQVSKWGNSLAVRIPQRIFQRTVASCCGPRAVSMTCGNWCLELRGRIAIPTRTGDRPPARNRGDFPLRSRRRRFHLTFDPQAGHEQAGRRHPGVVRLPIRRRPALVLSPKIYNQKSGLALVCPLTNQAKGYPFEVPVPGGHGVAGIILADHLKSVDWNARRAERMGRCPGEVINEVLARLAPLLGY